MGILVLCIFWSSYILSLPHPLFFLYLRLSVFFGVYPGFAWSLCRPLRTRALWFFPSGLSLLCISETRMSSGFTSSVCFRLKAVHGDHLYYWCPSVLLSVFYASDRLAKYCLVCYVAVIVRVYVVVTSYVLIVVLLCCVLCCSFFSYDIPIGMLDFDRSAPVFDQSTPSNVAWLML